MLLDWPAGRDGIVWSSGLDFAASSPSPSRACTRTRSAGASPAFVTVAWNDTGAPTNAVFGPSIRSSSLASLTETDAEAREDEVVPGASAGDEAVFADFSVAGRPPQPVCALPAGSVQIN